VPIIVIFTRRSERCDDGVERCDGIAALRDRPADHEVVGAVGERRSRA
jgi:hypothetical protein